MKFKSIEPKQEAAASPASRGRILVRLELKAEYEIGTPTEASLWKVLREMADLLEAEAAEAFVIIH